MREADYLEDLDYVGEQYYSGSKGNRVGGCGSKDK